MEETAVELADELERREDLDRGEREREHAGPGKEQHESRAAGRRSLGVSQGQGEAVDEEDRSHEGHVRRAFRLPCQDWKRKGGAGQCNRSAGRHSLEVIDGKQDERKPETGIEVGSRLERRRPAAEAEDHAGHQRGDGRGPEPPREQGRKQAREGRPQEEGQGPGERSRQEAVEKVRRIEEGRLRISDERGAEEQKRVPERHRARGEGPAGIDLPGIELCNEISHLRMRRHRAVLLQGFPGRKPRHHFRRQRHPSEQDGPVDDQGEPAQEEQAPFHEQSEGILHASSAAHPLARA